MSTHSFSEDDRQVGLRVERGVGVGDAGVQPLNATVPSLAYDHLPAIFTAYSRGFGHPAAALIMDGPCRHTIMLVPGVPSGW